LDDPQQGVKRARRIARIQHTGLKTRTASLGAGRDSPIDLKKCGRDGGIRTNDPLPPREGLTA